MNIDAAQALAARTGAEALADWKAVVASDVDAVMIATTHDALAKIARGAVETGKHVMVEKPAGRTLAEVAELAKAAERTGCTIKVGFSYRFHPAIAKAKEMVDAGAVGPLMFVRGRHGHGGRIGYEKEWRCKPDISGGGELIDQGSHLMDLARWLMGDLDLAYAAVPHYFWDAPVEDNCFIALRGAEGQMAWLHASWSEWKNMFAYEIYGRDGKLTINGLGGSYGTERLTYHRMLPEMGPPETMSWEYPGPDLSWRNEHKEFATAVAEGRRPIGDINDAHAVWKLIDRIYADAS
jgi:predicted dehydrogenase